MKALYSNIVSRFPFLRATYFWTALIVAGIPLKLILFSEVAGDFMYFLDPWIRYIKTHGYFSSLKDLFYN